MVGNALKLVAGMGLALDILRRISNSIREHGGSMAFLHMIVTSAELPAKIAQVVIDEAKKLGYIFSLRIDRKISRSERLRQAGLDSVDSNILGKTPDAVSDEVEEVLTILFHFGREISSTDARAQMAEDGYSPGGADDAIALTTLKPNQQRSFMIVALDEPGEQATVLSVNGTKRHIGKSSETQWHESCRFIGVRRLKQTESSAKVAA